jgi:hypothetical protein
MWRNRFLAALLASLIGVTPIAAAQDAAKPDETKAVSEESGDDKTASAEPNSLLPRICELIEVHAEKNGLPKEFFARLIWKESRFDHRAVSPAGAEGVAQFMPATAKARGVTDSFDIEQAIPASAAYLAQMKRGYGNLGLAAAAYNAGETRISSWLGSGGGFLPLETEDYVLDITGEPAENFTDRDRQVANKPLAANLTFREGCLKLPVIKTRTVPMARIARKPWAIQVAGNFKRSAAVAQWERMRRQIGGSVAKERIYVNRVKSPIGRRGIYAVRIGADNRGEADSICSKLRARGGACVVLKNR